jgi:D-arginine dehydrogenase
LVVGADPRIDGLHWTAGLGGFGMSTGVAAGELCAEVIFGKEPALAPALSPARFLRAGGA